MEPKGDLSFKAILESAAYEWQKSIVAREINQPKVPVDFKIFKKTPEEKDLVKTFKLNTPKKRPTLIGRFQF